MMKIIQETILNKTIWGFIQKEFKQVLRDNRMRLILFGVPVIQMTLFGIAISTEIKNIRLVTIYSPHDSLAREIANKALASTWFIPSNASNTEIDRNDPFDLIRANKADAVLVTPREGLEKALQRENAHIQLLINASNVVKAQQIERYVQNILNAQINKNANPKLQLDIRTLYNPTMKTAVFMVPGIMCLALSVVTVLLTSMSLAREKEIGTIETLIVSPAKTWEILAGKTFPYVIMGMINIPITLGVAFFGFGVPMRGSILELILASFAFLCTTVCIGTLISTLAKNQQQAMLGGFLFVFPAVQFAGIMFPLENMPTLMYGITYLNPLRYYATLLRNIMLKGGTPEIVWKNTLILFFMAFVSIIFSFKRFRHTLQ